MLPYAALWHYNRPCAKQRPQKAEIVLVSIRYGGLLLHENLFVFALAFFAFLWRTYATALA